MFLFFAFFWPIQPVYFKYDTQPLDQVKAKCADPSNWALFVAHMERIGAVERPEPPTSA